MQIASGLKLQAFIAALMLCVSAGSAHALTCNATISPINFGSISVRAGAVNQTSGTVNITCTGAVVSAVGACVRLGPGSGGAGTNNSPRYMRNSNGKTLNYELRPNGNGSANGTWNSVYVLIPVLLGYGSYSLPIYGTITSDTVSVETGAYSSVFSGSPNAKLVYGVASCLLLGQESVIPDFEISADVVASCELDVTAMNFGEIGTVVNSPVDQTATVNVRCTDNTPYSVTMSQGSGGGTGPTDRRMRNGGHELKYGLYQDAGYSAPWGGSATNDVDATGQGSNQAYTIYGRIHGGQSAQFGLYSDNVVVTVTY